LKLDISNAKPLQDDGMFCGPWISMFTKIRVWIVANSQYGTTAQRPTKGLSPGDKFMDTTLGYIVHVRSVNPVVWVNGAGTVV
jgi:hypothetical protein